MKGKNIIKLLRNKYLITFVVFSVWLIVFDQHNLIDRLKTRQYLNELVQDTVYFHNKLIDDREVIHQLQTNIENLEKFAREEYLMKAEDEDVFIIKKKQD